MYKRQVQAASARADELEALLRDLQQKSEASGEQRGAVEGRLTAMAAESTDLKVAAAAADSAVEAARARLAAAESERENTARQLAALQEEQADTEKFLADANEKLQRLENIKAGLSLKLDSRKKALAEADEAEQKLLRDIEAAAGRIALLKDLDRNMDGFQHSVKTVMKASQGRRLRGILGPVSTILSVKRCV